MNERVSAEEGLCPAFVQPKAVLERGCGTQAEILG